MDKVKPGLQIKNFNMLNAMGRIKEQGDLFKGVLGKGIDLARAEKSLQKLLKF